MWSGGSSAHAGEAHAVTSLQPRFQPRRDALRLAEDSMRLFASEARVEEVITAAEQQVSQADIGHHAEPAAFRLQA